MNLEGRIHLLKVEIAGAVLTLVNVYGPNKEMDRKVFLDKLQNILISYDFGDYVIIGGDFNIVQDNSIDKYAKKIQINQNCQQTWSQATLKNLKESYSLVDIWRHQNQTTKRYTWSQPKPLVRCRLDYFLVSRNLLNINLKTNIKPAIKTDHSLIELTIKFSGPPRGPGIWKLNTSLLQDEAYKNKIKALINKSWDELEENENLALRFDWVKYKIRQFSIVYSKEKAKKDREKELKIQKELTILDEKICTETITDQELNLYDELKKQLESYEEYKARGAWIRSRLERIELDEKSTAFFYNRSKQIFEKKTIHSIVTDDSDEISDPKEILKELEKFYRDLYKSASKGGEKASDFLEESDITARFTDKQRDTCEGYLTLPECYNSLKMFKQNKSPGCDGLPAEFYLAFWPEIGNKLVKCLNYCLDKNSLSLSQRRGVITLLEKKGKDPHKIKNWRPVTLLNTDYKILTKSLSRRIEKYIPDVIHPDQSGFVKNRFIGEPIRFVEDLIEKFDREDKPGIVMQLDFEKAFDSIEWNFLFEVLRKLNLGETFIRFVRCCYKDIYSCINNNGFTTNWFKLGRGVRQGCPLSCILFILCVEIMGNRIRKNVNIKGLKIGEFEHKLKQFADDCSCFLRNIESIYTLIDCIKGFSQHSGLKLNSEKSILFFLGPWKYKEVDILNMKIERFTLNMLGIEIGRNEVIKQQRNFEHKIPKLINQLHIHSQRDLSLCGKILLTKTFGISKLIHPMSITTLNKDVLSRIQTELNKYIWSYKTPKVKHTVMMGDLSQSGLGSIDVECKKKSLRMPWLQRILQGKGWNDIIQEYFRPMGGLAFLLKCNYDTKLLNWIPKFYREMLDYNKLIMNDYAGECIIWNNKRIMIEEKSIFWRDWFEKGVIYIHDFLNSNGTWMSFDQFSNKFNIRTNFLKYLGMLSAVKRAANFMNVNLSIKPIINFQSYQYKLNSGRLVDLKKAKSRDFYTDFLQDNLEPPAAINKWRIEYDFDEDLFYNSLPLAKKCTKEPRLLAIQFKILHNITNCKSNLHKWKISENDICEFCESNKRDDIIHAFCECEHTKQFLSNAFQWIDPQERFSRQMEVENVLFGVDDSALNVIILLLKKYILNARTYKLKLTMAYISQQIFRRIVLDKKTMRLEHFTKKWQNFQNLVEQAQNYWEIHNEAW